MNRLISELQKSVKGLLNRIFSGHLETPLRQGSSKCLPLEILLIYSNKERKHGDGRLDRQVFSAPKRLTDAWMDMSPLSAMSQERRESQCMAKMTHLNAESSNRKIEEALHLHEQASRGSWNATHGTTHGSLFSIQ